MNAAAPDQADPALVADELAHVRHRRPIPPAARRTVVGGGEDRGTNAWKAPEPAQVVLGVVGLVEVARLASVGLSFLILFLL